MFLFGITTLYNLFSCNCLPPIPSHHQVWWPLSPSHQCQHWGPVSISFSKAHKLLQGKGRRGTIPSGSPKGILVFVPSPGWAGVPSQESMGCFSMFPGRRRVGFSDSPSCLDLSCVRAEQGEATRGICGGNQISELCICAGFSWGRVLFCSGWYRAVF